MNIAIFVHTFLTHTHPWIYRQMNWPGSSVKLVLCQERIENNQFPFQTVIVSPPLSKFASYMKARFWSFFKNFSPVLRKKNLRSFEKAIKNHQINLVHAHFGTNGVLIAPVCEKLNIPLVVTFHGFDISSAPLRYPGYKRSLLKLFDKIEFAIAISDEMKNRLIKIGCPEEKIRVSYLGVPLRNYPIIQRDTKRKKVRFLHAGRLTAKKGVADLIRSFEKVVKINDHAVLDLAGDGEELELIKRTIRNLNIEKKIILHGRVSDKELIELRNNADIFVLNCRTDKYGTKEGLPISTLEAAASGLPAISTFHAGIPESILDKKTGLLVNEFDIDAMTNAMIKLLDPETRLQYGKNARKFMEEKFDLDKCNLKLEEIYKEAINNY